MRAGLLWGRGSERGAGRRRPWLISGSCSMKTRHRLSPTRRNRKVCTRMSGGSLFLPFAFSMLLFLLSITSFSVAPCHYCSISAWTSVPRSLFPSLPVLFSICSSTSASVYVSVSLLLCLLVSCASASASASCLCLTSVLPLTCFFISVSSPLSLSLYVSICPSVSLYLFLHLSLSLCDCLPLYRSVFLTLLCSLSV